MSQKASVMQLPQFVPKALTSDTRYRLATSLLASRYMSFRWVHNVIKICCGPCARRDRRGGVAVRTTHSRDCRSGIAVSPKGMDMTSHYTRPK